MGLCIDASSGYEIQRAMRAGLKPSQISLSSQELPQNFDEYVKQGVTINACSLSQLDRFGARFPGGEVRLDPQLSARIQMCGRADKWCMEVPPAVY